MQNDYKKWFNLNRYSWKKYYYNSTDLDNIAREIAMFMIKWGRIPVRDYKEKYDTVRIYCGFGISNLYWFVKPNYLFYNKWRWLRKYDDFIFGNFFRLCSKPIYLWQKFIYRQAYKNVVKYCNDKRKEKILCCADFGELLKGLNG